MANLRNHALIPSFQRPASRVMIRGRGELRTGTGHVDIRKPGGFCAAGERQSGIAEAQPGGT